MTARSWAHVERVGVAAELRATEERLRLAVDNAEVGFWDVDLVNDCRSETGSHPLATLFSTVIGGRNSPPPLLC